MRIIDIAKSWVDRMSIGPKQIIRRELKSLSLRSEMSSGMARIRVLDIGSSSGEIWLQIASESWLKHNKISLEVTCLDANAESLRSIPSQEDLSVSFRLGLAPDSLLEFRVDEFSLVTALDVIEHLSKSEGYRLLYEINRISPVSIIQCPNGFLWQAPFERNPFQAHLSGWTSHELRELGWKKQFGLGGPKALIGIGAIPKWEISRSKFRKLASWPERIVITVFNLMFFRAPNLFSEVIAVRQTRAFDLESYTEGRI